MCTAMTMQTAGGEVLFGRTMDFSYPLEPELYVVPRGYEWNNLTETHRISNRYGYMGIGQNISPVFADGLNEEGFAAAALYFPGYAQYDPISPKRNAARPAVAAIELVGFLLGLCASVEQAVTILSSIQIVGVKDSVTNSIAPLHWLIADQTGRCMAVEKCADGLHLMENPIGVLSNSPDFHWHMANLRNYQNIVPTQRETAAWGAVELTPFGQGAGTFGLPGDYTPPSRFVRTAYQKSHAELPADRDGAVVACFHILESVSIPKGVVVTSRGTSDYTQYTAFLDLTAKEYFFKTYDNSQILSARLPIRQSFDPKLLSLGKLKRPVSFGRLKFE